MNDRPKPEPPARPDDNPEWTEEDFARARPASQVHGPEIGAGMVRKQGRPKLPASERKQPVSIRLSPDVLEALRATGDGWQTRVDELLRAALLPETLAPRKELTRDEVAARVHRTVKQAKAHAPTLFERMANLSRAATDAEADEQAAAKAAEEPKKRA